MNTTDQHHITAARGWIELGLFKEAMAELDEIASETRGHLDVIKPDGKRMARQRHGPKRWRSRAG